MKKRAIVTGATGFVGSNLAKKLISNGWEVHTINRRVTPFLDKLAQLGVKNTIIQNGSESLIPKIISSINPHVVFHLAACVITNHVPRDIDQLMESNIIFGAYILEGLRDCETKNIINTGTFWQHYLNNNYSAVNLYAASKQAFQSIIDFYVESYSIKAITLKLFDNYGPNDSRNKLFNQLSKAAKTGNDIDMTMGEQIINLVYIDDVVESFVVAYDLINDATFNGHSQFKVSSSEEISLKDLVLLYEKTLGKPIKINWGAKPYRDREMFYCPKIGSNLPNWTPKVTLQKGLKLLIDIDNA
jgi:nucleoside-diphosphate-sugar epimerase